MENEVVAVGEHVSRGNENEELMDKSNKTARIAFQLIRAIPTMLKQVGE